MSYKLYATIMVLAMHTQSSAMIVQLARAAGSSTKSFVRHCHGDNIKRELVKLQHALSMSKSERQACCEALRGSFKPLVSMDLYYQGIIEVYDQQIQNLRSCIADLESQFEASPPSKNNPHIVLAQLEYQITELRNKRHDYRIAPHSSSDSQHPGCEQKMQQYTQNIQSLEKRIQSLSIQLAIKG